jgi:hypothetical protein
MVVAERQVNGETTIDERYFIYYETQCQFQH